jgi:TPP-dependent trihydroxycyclohexane-1,2-dione (THcHDO) dehydratase
MANTSRGTVRLTVGQALVTYLSRHSVADGHRRRLIPAALGIFGHGNVAGLGQALDQFSSDLPFIQGRNEQALVHMASGYAKATRRHATLAVTASIGPGAMNLVTRRRWRRSTDFRYRDDALALSDGQPARKPARLEGEYLGVDLVQIAGGLGARAIRATTASEVRDALTDTRDHDGPFVIVIPAIPHAELPGAGVWWDVAPAEVSDQDAVAQLRADYEAGLPSQRWFG